MIEFTRVAARVSISEQSCHATLPPREKAKGHPLNTLEKTSLFLFSNPQVYIGVNTQCLYMELPCYWDQQWVPTLSSVPGTKTQANLQPDLIFRGVLLSLNPEKLNIARRHS